MAVAFEDVIDAPWRTVAPAVDLAAKGRFVKPLRVQFVVLVYVFAVADDVLVSLLAGRRIEIADDQVASDAEMLARGDQPFQVGVFLVEAMVGPAQMHVGDVQQAEAGQVDATDGDVARHVVVFTAIVRDVSGIIVS